MLVMNATEARANFSMLLKRVETDGAAIIKRSNGRSFRITIEESENISPLASAKPVLGNVPIDEVLEAVRESRERM